MNEKPPSFDPIRHLEALRSIVRGVHADFLGRVVADPREPAKPEIADLIVRGAMASGCDVVPTDEEVEYVERECATYRHGRMHPPLAAVAACAVCYGYLIARLRTGDIAPEHQKLVELYIPGVIAERGL